MDDNAVIVKDLKKSFKLPHESHSGLKQAIVSIGKKHHKGYEVQEVLKGLSFEVKKGDFFGIVGRNGSGKSTLLKLLAGIYTPDSGIVQTHGSVVPFIELGVGFNPELTGRENVFLNGALLGFSNNEMKAMYDEIVEFAELEQFMDQKLKNYSSGMQVRLAFSIAIKAQGDVLILDEVLAVGDEAFQKKCNDFFEKIKEDRTKTVILVTHSMESVRKYCNKAIMLQAGKVVATGSPDKVADEYSLANLLDINKVTDSVVDSDGSYLSVKLLSQPLLTSRDTLKVEAKYRAPNDRPVMIKFAPLAYGNASLMTANSKVLHDITTADEKEHLIHYELPLADFNSGDLTLVVLLADVETKANIADYGYNGELSFKISDGKNEVGGVFKNKGDIKLVK